MKISSLQTFLAIMETGSLSRAADRLNITQSTVTARLQALEDSIGQRLVNRQKSGATPTAAGLRLRRYAEAMSDLWRQARQDVALPAEVRLVCNLGCDFNLWAGIGEVLFTALQRAQPNIAISVWAGNTAELASWLDAGLIDLAIGHAPSAASNQTAIRLADDRLVLVSPHAGTPVTFDPGYVFVEAGDEFARDHAAAYASADTANISFNQPEWALDHIRQHGGSAYLPLRLVEAAIGSGKLHRLQQAPEFQRPIFLLRNLSTTSGWAWLDTTLAGVVADIGSARA